MKVHVLNRDNCYFLQLISIELVHLMTIHYDFTALYHELLSMHIAI